MLRVGLTGGIGCGKSIVATGFAEHQVPVIDTDLIAHQLTAPHGDALPAIQTAFGVDALQADGALDRAAMRRRIFSDAIERQKLQAILHPLILQAVQQQLQRLAKVPYVLIVVPLLLETDGYRSMIDRVLVEAVMAAQVNRPTRLAAADDVLTNTGDLASLYEQITPLHHKYLKLSRKQL
jgi:dephospho-CoA kinase